MNLKKKAVIDALEKSLGVVTTACRSAGIGRTQYYNWLKDDPEFAEEVRSIENISLDFAESQLHKRMKEGSDAAIIFFLKCKAKSRGYIERQETHLVVDNYNMSEQELRDRLSELDKTLDDIED